MKKFILSVLCATIMTFMTSPSSAQYTNTIQIATDQRIAAGGTSIFMLDISSTQLPIREGLNALTTIAQELSNVNPLDAKVWSLQFATATPYSTNLGGATIPPISYAVANELPTGVGVSSVGTLFDGKNMTEKLDFSPVTTKGVAHDSGLSKYQYRWYAKAGKYHLFKIDNSEGARDFRMTFGVQMHKTADPVYAIQLATLQFRMTATTGTSFFSNKDSSGVTMPEGTRYLIIKSADNGNSVYVTWRSGVSRDADWALQAGEWLPIAGNFEELKRLGLAASVPGVTGIANCWTAKPN